MAVAQVQDAAQDVIADPVEDAQAEFAAAITNAVSATQAVVVGALPADVVPPAVPTLPKAATTLIVRWEVTSPAYYSKRLERPVWPGGASGVTWGIGYDGGHQSAEAIRADWSMHPAVERLSATSGVRGAAAAALVRQLRDVRTPLDMAEHVFTHASLPKYHAAARRALGPGFDTLPDASQGALDSLGYNRGWLMSGPNRREMREIRDTCIPANDSDCIAAHLRAMKRLWPTSKAPHPGLRNRREDEARTAEGKA